MSYLGAIASSRRQGSPTFDSGLIINGTHDDATNIEVISEWTVTTGVDGVANFPDNGIAGEIIYDLSSDIVEGNTYTLTFDLVGATGTGRFALDGYSATVGQMRQFLGNANYSTGTITINFSVGAGDVAYSRIQFRASSASASAFTIDNLSLTQQ